MSVIELNQNKKSKAGVVFPLVQGQNLELSSTARLEEAVGLALAINLETAYQEIVKIREIKPSTFFSQGVLDRIADEITNQELDLLIVDTTLSPIQQRNLERKLKIKVIDRTALILEIFGERAQTKEGKLQVELAHLTYQRSRLVRSWTHLERQRGGAGFLGGPGETQIELDRRIIDDKIIKIKKELEKVKQTRQLQRSSRKKIPYPIVALVGYTNAGKSSIFNLLSNAGVFAQDLLFATLDNTMRKITLPSGTEIIITDTVGFISDLPHELVMSFRATLEEVLEADIVVHVRDVSNENRDIQKKDVLTVLKNLGLDEIEEKSNYIELLNKTDLLSEQDTKWVKETASRNHNLLPISAHTGEGCKEFLDLIDQKLALKHNNIRITIEAEDGKLISWLHQNSRVLSSELKNQSITIYALIEDAALSRLKNKTKNNIKIIN